MDDFSKHLTPYPRRFSAVPPVHSIGYMTKKNKWVDGPFRTVNFSFILSGSGEYTCPDGTWRVVAPCVITQWPVVHFHYGPETTWEEFYVCFPGKFYRHFLKDGLMDVRRRMWQINDFGRFNGALQNFIELLEVKNDSGWVDRLDLEMQHVVMESLLGAGESPDENTKIINAIKRKIEANYLADYDFDELALDAGLSPSSFRRYWGKVVAMPPARYVTQLRIARAQRYLIETPLPIAEIAEKVGFDDQLYFTRKFRQFVGVCPTEYRRTNRMPHISSQ